MEILDLPEEVLLLIFSYIPLYNLFFSVQRTCQAWRNLCFHHSLWSTVHYSKQIDEKLSQDDLLDVLKQVSRGLHHLVFEKAFQHGEMNHTFLKILQCILNEDVDMRNISSLTIPDIPNRYLEPLLEKCSNLSSIEVSYYYAYYNKGDFFVTMKKLPHLKVFKITESSKSVESIAEPALNQHMFNLFLSDMFCSLVDLEVVHIATVNKLADTALGALLHNCKNLQELALYGCDSISNAGFKNLPEKSGITSLHLNSTSVNDKGMEHICRSCNGLRKVSFAGCMYVTDISIKHLCKNCPNLESLCVSDPEIFYHKSNITDGGLDYLSQNSHFLRSLTMCNSAQISDLGLDQLARSCSKLTHLDVSGCLSVSDNTLQVLAQHCSHLQTVNFSECVHLTGKGLNPLVVSCKWLKTLNVANCPFVESLNFELFEQMETPFDRYLRERGEFSQRSNQLNDEAGKNKEESDQEKVQLENLEKVPGTCSNHEQEDGGKPQECVEKALEGVQKPQKDLKKPLEDVEKLHEDLEEPLEDVEKLHEDLEEPLEELCKDLEEPQKRDEKPHEDVEKPHEDVEKPNDVKPHESDLKSKCEKTNPRLNFLNSLSCSSIPSPKVHSELRILNIGLCSKITDNCLRQIATYCPDLRELDINGCFNTTDLGISYIVRGCQRLELLNISSGSMIQKMCLTDQSLVSIASHCKYLRRLHVEKNPLMSLEGYKNLFDNCPLPCTVSLTTKSPEILKRDILMVDDSVSKCKRVNVFSKGCYKGNIHQLDVLLYNSDGHILE